MGVAARNRVVERWSLEAMVGGYEELITEIYEQKERSPQPTFAFEDERSGVAD
jgi:hypothetical protein